MHRLGAQNSLRKSRMFKIASLVKSSLLLFQVQVLDDLALQIGAKWERIGIRLAFLMKNHFRCYFTVEIQQLRLHLIMTSTMPCVIAGLISITWPNNFVVRKLYDSFSYSIFMSWTMAVSYLESKQTPNPAPFFISLPTSKRSDNPVLRNTALHHV